MANTNETGAKGGAVMATYYAVYETGTDDYAVGPFPSRDEAREHCVAQGDVEGDEQGQFFVVPKSKIPARILKAVR